MHEFFATFQHAGQTAIALWQHMTLLERIILPFRLALWLALFTAIARLGNEACARLGKEAMHLIARYEDRWDH